MRNVRQILRYILVLAVVAGVGTVSAYAVTSSSNNYQITEGEFGSVSNSKTCQAGTCARVTLGDLNTDRASSTNFTTFGPQLSTDPVLEIITDPGVSSLGVLSSTTTGTKLVSLKVRTYLTSGYTIQIVGTPPKYGAHVLNTPSEPTTSQPGTEQFALNLVANDTPNVGQDPLQIPNENFSYGVVESDYNQANKFMYRSGAVVARSSVASGETDYTVTIIVNISGLTPSGDYRSDFSAVIAPIF